MADLIFIFLDSAALIMLYEQQFNLFGRLGRVGLNLALGLVTSCCSCQTA